MLLAMEGLLLHAKTSYINERIGLFTLWVMQPIPIPSLVLLVGLLGWYGEQVEQLSGGYI
jgi:xanthosine utilization system XapX-like protein